MEHGASGLTEIAIVALVAMACGIAMERVRQPAIVGYILAGAILGPSVAGLVHDQDAINLLAELGVLMLLYVIGMELSLRAFRRVWKLALSVTLGQIALSVGLMLAFQSLLGWSTGLALLLGFVVALSSTAVAIKVLEGMGQLRTKEGRITVGVLIAQDLAVVPMMLTVTAMGGGEIDWFVVPKVIGSIVFIAALIWWLSRGKKVRLPFLELAAGNIDIKPLAALGFCFGAAAVSGLIGLSAAYGAFLAGLVIGNSTERHRLMEATLPIQSVLMMVFFVSIGLLIDIGHIWDNIGTVLLLLVFVTVLKTVLNVGLLHLFGIPWQTAFFAGVMLAQIGEFSFLLAHLGVDAGVLGGDEARLVAAVTVLSLSISPLWVVAARRLQDLALAGRESAADIVSMVVRPEAALVAETIEKSRSGTRLLSWRVSRAMQAAREKRRAKKAVVKTDKPDAGS